MSGVINHKYTILLIAAAFILALACLSASEALGRAMPVLIYGGLGLVLTAGLIALVSFAIIRWHLTRTKVSELINTRKLGDLQMIGEALRLLAYQDLADEAIHLVERGVIYPSNMNEGKFAHIPAANRIEQSAVPLLEVPRPQLLSAIRDCDNVLIVGGKGSGKTTLLQWIEAERLAIGQTIALDSHAVPGQWTGQSIGAGRNYSQIKNAMMALVDKMDRRHKKRTAGQTYFEPVHTLIDEFTLLPGYLKESGYNIQSYSFPLLTEGRKADMNCVWGSHSDRAKPLGLEGMADLRECFDAIVYLKKVQGDFYAICDFGEGKESIRYTLPGPFAPPDQNVQSLPATSTIAPPRSRASVLDMPMAKLQPTDHEQTVLDAARQATSFNGLHHKVSGTRTNVSSNQIEKYREILQRFGVNPSF